MTAIPERFGARTAPEGELMTMPPQGRYPMWLGVPGSDPQCPLADPDLAARLAVMRFSLHVFGADAARRPVLGRSHAQDWLRWLLSAPDDVDAYLRRYALRFACEEAAAAGIVPRDILETAQQLHAACTPR